MVFSIILTSADPAAAPQYGADHRHALCQPRTLK